MQLRSTPLDFWRLSLGMFEGPAYFSILDSPEMLSMICPVKIKVHRMAN